jgi:hypothetical protein
MPKMLIGIDPDVDKSGFAFLIGNKLQLKNLTFFEIFETLRFYKEKIEKPTVYIEMGSLNKSNWHTKNDMSAKYNSQIGAKTGRNFEVANKLVEMCQYLEIEYHSIKPTRKKVDSKTFQQLTGLKIRTNQETRDAFMLIMGR